MYSLLLEGNNKTSRGVPLFCLGVGQKECVEDRYVYGKLLNWLVIIYVESSGSSKAGDVNIVDKMKQEGN